MHVGQILAFVGATASICGVMLGLVLRSMSSQRSELSAKIDGLCTALNEKIDGVHTGLNEKIQVTHVKIDGLRNEMHEKVDGLRNEMHEKIDGLRNEMNARLVPLGRDVDRLDQDVRELKKEIANSGQRQLS